MKPFVHFCYLAPISLSQPKTYSSVCVGLSETVSYQELKKLLKSNKIFLIDVREPWELTEYGQIPGSINVPRKYTIMGVIHLLVYCNLHNKYIGNI